MGTTSERDDTAADGRRQSKGAGPVWAWREGDVDPLTDHLSLWSVEHEVEIARVGPPKENTFAVQFFSPEGLTGSALEEVRAGASRELDFYLVELGEPDPWLYARYHCGTYANFYANVQWAWMSKDEERDQELDRLVDEAWDMHRRSVTAPASATVEPSVPILFFGDLAGYRASPVKIVTVGLNPSLEEFPVQAPWSRFPALAPLAGRETLTADDRRVYLESLSSYFQTDPYRRWFDQSYEPLLRGAGASFYPGAASVALHTDVASPIATSPTWSGLTSTQKQPHQGGATLWQGLIDVLSPDLIVMSVAQKHLSAITSDPLSRWRELWRVERTTPFVVWETTTETANLPMTLVVHGRCTNVPFGNVSFADRERIGEAIATRLRDIKA